MQKQLIANRCFALKIHDCPTEIITLAASLGYDNVSVENFSHDYTNPSLVRAEIRYSGVIILNLQSYLLYFTVSKTDFISLTDIQNQKGCYAVFHQSSLLKFNAFDLPEAARYKALDNFK